MVLCAYLNRRLCPIFVRRLGKVRVWEGSSALNPTSRVFARAVTDE